MASEVKKWEDGVQLVVGKLLAWLLFGLWLIVRWTAIGLWHKGKQLEQWWSSRKGRFNNLTTIQTKHTA